MESQTNRRFGDLTWTEAMVMLGRVFGLYVKITWYSVGSWAVQAIASDEDGRGFSRSECEIGETPEVGVNDETLESAAERVVKLMFETRWPRKRRLGIAYMEFPKIGGFDSLPELELKLAAAGIDDYYFNPPPNYR